jgi:hypothetical protein
MSELFRYLQTRLLRWQIALLWAVLIATLLVSVGAVGSPAAQLTQSVLLLVAILVFRLWDDLADREHDRLRHPERVLVKARELTPFIVVLLAGLLSVAFLLRGDVRQLLFYLGLVALLAALYHGGLEKVLARSVRSGLVLLKYPLFVYLLVTPTWRAWLAGLGLYVLLLVFEWRDDPDLREAAPLQLLAAAATGIAIISALYWLSGALT